MLRNLQMVLKNLPNFYRLTSRNYAFKSDLKIKWVRPEKVSCILPEKSGDKGTLPPLNPKDIILPFKNSEELKNADDVIKSLFTYESNPRKYGSELYKDIFVKEVQRHALDSGSMESKLAQMTATIRRHQQVMAEFPRNKRLKVELKELIDKRKKFLKFVRRWDYKRFEWLLEKLDLEYKPPPAEFHWITRKESLKKLTDIHCENIRNEKLAAYRKELESKQIPFLEEKLKNLEFIKKEQEECQVPVTISDEQIKETRKRLEGLRQKRNVDEKVKEK